MKTENLKPLLSVKDITIRVYDSFFFEHTHWQMLPDEQWVIIGPNGAGKSIFAKALTGIIPLQHGEIVSKGKIAYLSFDTQQQKIQKEERMRDLISGIGKETKGQTVKKFLGIRYKKFRFKNIFSIDALFTQLLHSLSTGEMRKVFLIQTLLQNPRILILDEPYDGLDSIAKKSLSNIIEELMVSMPVILITHHFDEIPKKTTHVLVMKNCKVLQQGEKEDILPKYFSRITSANKKLILKSVNKNHNEVLIEMKNVTVTYYEKKILNNISWTVRKGENWVILGPNGAGKSTLIQLITGDNQQAYANDIFLFGKKKGTAISLWEIKKHIGIVSSHLMLHYDKQLSAQDIILSGFFDSIGLYQKVSEKQKRAADKIIEKLKLQQLIKRNYQQLSFGQRRLILIARALVKSPELLIVDEPFHGLDQENKRRVFEMLNKIGTLGKTTLILITHNESEIPSCITNQLILKKGEHTISSR